MNAAEGRSVFPCVRQMALALHAHLRPLTGHVFLLDRSKLAQSRSESVLSRARICPSSLARP